MTNNYTVSSASTTALDTTPTLRPDTGQGAPGELKQLNDYVALTTGQLGSTSTKAQIIRLPSTCKLKSLTLSSSVQLDGGSGSPALAFNVGAYYSDAPMPGTATNTNVGNSYVQDGTAPSNAGTVISATSFASAVNAHAAALSKVQVGFVDPAKTNQPLWQALGISADPGGYIDVVVAVSVAAAGGTITAGNLGCSADFVM